MDIDADLLVIGAGAGGLGLSSVATRLGFNVVLLESGKMGGDCLNYGCVPSKALIACAAQAQSLRVGAVFGVGSVEPQIDFAKVMDYVASVVSKIAVHDSVERFESLGVRVIQSAGTFIDENTVMAGEHKIRARKIVLATGSSPLVPNIPGLSDIDYLTNESVFSLREQPKHLIVIGGGPIGCEMAQAFSRLGTKVTMLVRSRVLSKDEPELAKLLKDNLVTEGITIHENCGIDSFSKDGHNIIIKTSTGKVVGTQVLVAVGRVANTDKLNLSNANIAIDKGYIVVNSRLRTTNKKVYAIGDVIGHHAFTHAAEYQVGVIVTNLFFKIPKKVNYRAFPWVTYCSPEFAHVGLKTAEALSLDPKGKTLTWSFTSNDRATTANTTLGKVIISVNARSVVVGASILGPNAGDLIQSWTNVIANKRKIGELANIIVPYPTYAEINKRVSGSYFTDKLFSNKVKSIVKFLYRL
ncbi:MAG: FAD-dependent oxidoreductase [Francisellaceae bacterium]|jgi:pyruvate/2-oxoglutarate dehydrogenase complex dihydrolipoamide dehydrogenase (E3) component|nr:FAD-dependent oxidoreductase [Francisellaceae bacterium]MBT6206488.1 FAD-dependent oxidoreductase [Francisellaceae bacterium]MBT6539335.1 FAD-dependent oxidoreductase [Francisellaceae bacterium]